jgi:hypothetical protein
MTIQHFKDTPSEAAKAFECMAKRVRDAQLKCVGKLTWQSSNLANVSIDQKFAKMTDIIYVMFVSGPVELKRCEDAYERVRSKNLDNRAYARLNKDSRKDKNCLYVGSVTGTGGLGARLNQHLGFGARATYALHLETWCKELEGLEIATHIHRCTPGDKIVVRALEDHLASQLSPLMGRRGIA